MSNPTSRPRTAGFNGYDGVVYPPIVATDEIGRIAESDGIRFYVTECCRASAKGGEFGTICRNCYSPIDARLGGVPAQPTLSAFSAYLLTSISAAADNLRRVTAETESAVDWTGWGYVNAAQAPLDALLQVAAHSDEITGRQIRDAQASLTIY
jgi:hypothetical protein